MSRDVVVSIASCLLILGCFSTNPDDVPLEGTEQEGGSNLDTAGTAGTAGSRDGATAGSDATDSTASGNAGDAANPVGNAPTGGTSPSAPTDCDASEAPRAVDKLDLLFMVDNSGSMAEEQRSLREQFPRVLSVLSTGDLDQDGEQDFAPVRDIHLGVVSSDMGLVGIAGIPGCEGLGDDGILNAVPGALEGCQSTYPRFLSYTDGVHDIGQTAMDLACLSTLGTEGCGFEQPLESVLKALWPSVDADPETGAPLADNRVLFLGDVNGFGQLGHGDTENAGFLRNDPEQGQSAIAVVLVTDEEDCSSLDTRHFTPPAYLAPDDPLASQDLNLRCFFNPQNLYPLERYVNGLKALRPGAEGLVVFGAIVGVPTDLVDSDTLAGVDFENEMQREAFYEGVLADARMQEVPDPDPTQGATVVPSCVSEIGRAFPPRRIVEVARRFGSNGAVGSICQEDFGPAIGTILQTIARRLEAPAGCP